MKRDSGAIRRILIVDGYNVIHARGPARGKAELEDARSALENRLHDYAGWTGQRVILVYDAWLSDRARRSVEDRGLMQVVFTMKGETADRYIERLCDELAGDVALRRAEVRVATSDRIEQTVTFGRGAVRMSARELLMEMDMAGTGRRAQTACAGSRAVTVAERLPAEIRARLEKMRRGENG